jgi:uncharacterized FAD-dependent dehydrogenase
MGCRIIELKLPTGYSEEELSRRIAQVAGSGEYTWKVASKSLDARKKSGIHWLIRVAVCGEAIQGGEPEQKEEPEVPYRKRNSRVLVTGSGPAGFFAAFVLQKAGFDTVLLERGADVEGRERGIRHFEQTGEFSPVANYSFGEGGAGTFSDGKLTSRTKHISRERDLFISAYIDAGAPAEIRYMAYPHVGSDNLKVVVKNLRELYRQLGGEIRFETTLTGLVSRGGKISAGETTAGEFSADHFIIAPGHSAYETYRMLMKAGVTFRTKNFALGSRAEHRQEIINQAQWGVGSLPGVKAAEYRLTSDGDGRHPVYSFCMCPGGMVVPAATYAGINIVNGMSNYGRDGRFANAACVAGVHPDQLAGRKVGPVEALDWLEALERSFFDFSGGYQAPFCTIEDFLLARAPRTIPESSYPLGLKPARLWEMLPASVTSAMRAGLNDFNRKIRDYDKGILLGLESKTSSPIQVLRESNGLCSGFSNLFLAGEGSGYSGGIVSSAADGIRTAFRIIGMD